MYLLISISLEAIFSSVEEGKDFDAEALKNSQSWLVT